MDVKLKSEHSLVLFDVVVVVPLALSDKRYKWLSFKDHPSEKGRLVCSMGGFGTNEIRKPPALQ